MAERSPPDGTPWQTTTFGLLLQNNGALMSKLLEHVPIMIVILDSEANALYTNKETERMLGWTQKEVREHPDFIGACYPDPAEREAAEEFLHLAESRWHEFRPANKYGVRVPCMSMSVRVGAVLFCVAIDLTERKMREDDERRAREDLEARVERRIPAAHPYGLTFRELTVLTLVAEGKTDREIASLLSIGCRTVQTHICNILTKMGAKVRTEAGVRAVREGIIE